MHNDNDFGAFGVITPNCVIKQTKSTKLSQLILDEKCLEESVVPCFWTQQCLLKAPKLWKPQIHLCDVAASASSAFHIPWRGIRSEDMKGPRQPHPEINTNINFRLSSRTNINRKPQFHSQVKRSALPKCAPFEAYTLTTYLLWEFCVQSIFPNCRLSQYKVIRIQFYLKKSKSNWLVLSMKGKYGPKLTRTRHFINPNPLKSILKVLKQK